MRDIISEPRINNFWKNFKKVWEKVLTRGGRCGIIIESPRKRGDGDLWKLNNKRRRTKQGILWGYSASATDLGNSFKRKLLLLKKVKMLRAKLESEEDWSILRDDLIQWFREFDPGSGWTLAACITHSSRTDEGTSVPELVADGWVTREQSAPLCGITSGNGR